jgi:hypothetical protein
MKRLSYYGVPCIDLDWGSFHDFVPENTAVGICHADHVVPSILKVGNHFPYKRR